MALTENRIREQLKTVPDPELNLNIVDLGLIYGIEFPKEGTVKVVMTMTFPGCPLAPYFEQEVPAALRKIPEVKDVEVELTFDPPWEPAMISEEAKEELRKRGASI